MQSDIVERLKATAATLTDDNWHTEAAVASEAATEITALRERVVELEGALRQIVDRPKGKPASGLAVVSELCLIANLALSDSPPATDGV
ncbi:hypothetical protein [Sphingobium abikonense]|uniref:hypothetical protein n=1 Tax=Sphingobium abikonense TaxID=86193 RepID=UPI0035126FD0